MSSKKTQSKVSPEEYRSPLMDMLYANILTPSSENTPPETGPDQAVLAEVLEEFLSVLKQTVQLSEEELANVRNGHCPESGALPNSYATTMANTLIRLENLLYVYSDTARFDSFAVWSYIRDHRSTNCENVDVQFSENKVVFRIPYLPRRNYGNNAVVNNMLAAKIYQLKNLPVWSKWTATFFHVYPTKTKSVPRDVDNYDYKKTIDLLAFAFSSADNALNFDIGGKHTIFTDRLVPGVYIEVTPKSSENEKFPEWKTLRGRPAKQRETAEKAT